MSILGSIRPQEVLGDHRHFVITCSVYPRSFGEHGGEAVHSRVVTYGERGRLGTVLELNDRNLTTTLGSFGNTPVLRAPLHAAPEIAQMLEASNKPVLAHSPSPEWQTALLDHLDPNRAIVWFHGFEALDYRRLFIDHSTADLAESRTMLNDDNRRRLDATRRTFSESKLRKIFVSDYLKQSAEFDVGVPAVNATVIPEFINTDYFIARRRTAADSPKLLLVSSFEDYHTGTDIAIKGLEAVSHRPGFRNLQITIHGRGRLFEEQTDALLGMPNVTMREGCPRPSEMAALFYDHGIFLSPSRLDTQCVTMGEAMASGMVCIASNVGAVSEFVDGSCARLVRPDDPWAFARALWEFVERPDLMTAMSEAAHARVRRQRSFEQTIGRELLLLEEAAT